MAQSLPNISGFAGNFLVQEDSNATGAFKIVHSWPSHIATVVANVCLGAQYTFDSSLSSSVYQNNSNVKPNSLSLIFVIKY